MSKNKRRSILAEQWIAYPREMITSPAMRVLSLSAIRVMRRIEEEHMAHGGADNGNLIVTFDQLVKWGVDRHCIAPAIRELVALGFLEITEPGCAGNENYRRAHRFRLTYVNTKRREQPTNEWNRIATIEDAQMLAKAARSEKDSRAVAKGRRGANARAKKKIPVGETLTVTVRETLTDETNLQWGKPSLLGSVGETLTTIYNLGGSP
jgi:hypothetical protein